MLSAFSISHPPLFCSVSDPLSAFSFQLSHNDVSYDEVDRLSVRCGGGRTDPLHPVPPHSK